MELKEFITETISAIADATTDLQAKYDEESGVIINPPLTKDDDHRYRFRDPDALYRYVSDVSFDVALTVSAGDSKGGGGGLKVFSASIEAKADKSNSTEQVSRVQFAIPITLGPTKAEAANHGAYQEREEKAQREHDEFMSGARNY